MKLHILLVTLALGGLAARDASAQANVRLDRVGGAIGYVSPEHIGGTFGLGVLADLGTVAPRVGLEARLDYWSSTEEAFGTKVRLRDVSVGVRGKYHFPAPGSRIVPFAGAGLGFHVLNAKITIDEPGFPVEELTDSSTRLGLDFGGGATTSIGPRTNLMGEVWYTVVSDVSQFSMRVGLSYKVGS